MMAESDYICRAAAIEAFDDRTVERYYGDVDPESVIRVIENIPAADVRPVVFCKDCIHSDTFAPDCTKTTFPLKCLFIRYGGVYPDWFCEHGEKREES